MRQYATLHLWYSCPPSPQSSSANNFACSAPPAYGAPPPLPSSQARWRLVWRAARHLQHVQLLGRGCRRGPAAAESLQRAAPAGRSAGWTPPAQKQPPACGEQFREGFSWYDSWGLWSLVHIMSPKSNEGSRGKFIHQSWGPAQISAKTEKCGCSTTVIQEHSEKKLCGMTFAALTELTNIHQHVHAPMHRDMPQASCCGNLSGDGRNLHHATKQMNNTHAPSVQLPRVRFAEPGVRA
eukprot:1159521-Pelagomonas_calceolata.AAC.16